MNPFYPKQTNYIDALNNLNNSVEALVGSSEPIIIDTIGGSILGDFGILRCHPFSIQVSQEKVIDSGPIVTKTLRYTLGAFADPMTSLSFTNLTSVDGDVNFVNANLMDLTTLSFPELILVSGNMNVVEIGDFEPDGILINLNVPKLKAIGGYLLAPTDLPNEYCDFPELEYVGGAINLSYKRFIIFPKLKTVGGGLTVYPYLGSSSSTCDFSSLETIRGQFEFTFYQHLTSFIAPLVKNIAGNLKLRFLTGSTHGIQTWNSLNYVATIDITTNAIMTQFNIPVIEHIVGNISITGCSELTTVSIGSTIKNIGGNVTITGAKLSQASVDSILLRLVGLNGSGGTTLYGSGKVINLTGGTSSTPSSTGLANKAILQARGATVTHN